MLSAANVGTFFGVYAVFGLLAGGMVGGVQLAVSMSNTGGAWDNAKKFIEQRLSDDPELKKGKVSAILHSFILLISFKKFNLSIEAAHTHTHISTLFSSSFVRVLKCTRHQW